MLSVCGLRALFEPAITPQDILPGLVISPDELFAVNNVLGAKVAVEMGAAVGAGDFVPFYAFLGEVGEAEFEDVEGLE